MKKKIVFFDVDGTLVTPHQEPTNKTKEALQKLRANGHLAFICTGRNRCMLEQNILDLGFDGIICSAGSYIEIEDTVIDTTYIEHHKIKEIMTMLEKNKVAYTLEGTHVTFADDSIIALFANAVDSQFDNSELERIHKEIEAGMNRKSMLEFYEHPQPIHKISFVAPSYEELKEPQQQLGTEFAFVVHDIFSKHSVNGEIIDRQTTKATAIEKVVKKLSLTIENTIAFGDSMNDYEMLQVVHHGVAMADGAKELQAIADAICPSVKEDGIYEELKKLKLI